MKKFLRRVSYITASLLLSGLTLLPAKLAFAANICQWTGTTSANWNTSTNWTSCGGTVPQNGDDVVFPASGASNLSMTNDISNLRLASMTFNGSNYSVAGNDLIISASGVNSSGTADIIFAGSGNTISTNLTLRGVNSLDRIGTGTNTITGQVTYDLGSSGGTFWDGNGDTGTLTLSGKQTGSIASTMQIGAGTGDSVVFSGANNDFTVGNGLLVYGSSVFECQSASCYGASSNVLHEQGSGRYLLTGSMTLSNDLDLNENADPAAVSIQVTANNSPTLSGNITMGGLTDMSIGGGTGTTLNLQGALATNGHTLGLNGSSAAHSSFDYAGSGITGSGTIACVTASCQFDTASASWSGNLHAFSGSVIIPHNAQGLGNATGNTTIDSGATLSLSSGFNLAEPLTIAGTGAPGFTGAIDDTAFFIGAPTLSGPITLSGDALIANQSSNFPFPAPALTITGSIGGTGNLTLTGSTSSNDIVLANSTPNTYVGKLIITGGLIDLNSNHAVTGDIDFNATAPLSNPGDLSMGAGTTDAIADTSVLNFISGGFLGTNGASDTIGGLEGTGSNGIVRLISPTDTLTIDQNANSTYGGDFDTSGHVIKKGSGTLTLTGTITGTTDFAVQAGALSINGNFSGNDFAVSGGKLKGNGTVNNVTATGGAIAPGNSPGTLNVTTLTLNSSSSLEEEIAGATAGTQYDQLLATGAVTLGNATLDIVPSYTPAVNTVFTIIDGGQSGSVSGIFNGLANGSTVTVSGLTFRVNYTATTVTLTFLSGTLVVAPASPSTPNTGLHRISTLSYYVAAILGLGIVVYEISKVRRAKKSTHQKAVAAGN